MNDKAERLNAIIAKIISTSEQVSALAPGTVTSAPLGNLPLWFSMGRIADALGYSDYGAFREAFLSLCYSIRDDLKVMFINKESVRTNWLDCILVISKVFDAENFGNSTSSVFSTYFSSRHLEILDGISERFQLAGFKESTVSEMEDALSAVRDVIEEFHKAEKLDSRIAAVLAHYLQQMETVFSQVEDFGDETFWKVYKETFATFMQLHPVIAGFDNEEEIQRKTATVWRVLTSKSIAGVAFGANMATLGQAVWPAIASVMSLKLIP